MIAVTYIDRMGTDLSVVNAARVSFGKKSEGVLSWVAYGDKLAKPVFVPNEADTKLIHYLANHGHYSPFGHCFASFHIKAPIFVARQLVKHEYLRMNEISRRYVDSEPEFYVPDVWRGRSEDKPQGSDGVVELFYDDESYLGEAQATAISMYQHLLKVGVAPEMARMVLPQ